jgi:death on curing protein
VNSQSDVIWIEYDVVCAIHEAQIAEHRGALGVRDRGLLASALDRPRNAAAYSEPDVAELAALYALGIMKNHPFVDGNKRVGAVLLELFLDLNGFDLNASDAELLVVILGVASGEIDAAELADWVRKVTAG